MVRLQVVLDGAEADALLALAASELRDPREQMRLIVRRELERLRLLPGRAAGPRGAAQTGRLAALGAESHGRLAQAQAQEDGDDEDSQITE